MAAFEEIGFGGDGPQRNQQPAAPKHKWRVRAETNGVQQFKCMRCGCTRTITARTEAVPLIRYLLAGRIYDGTAPPCRGKR